MNTFVAVILTAPLIGPLDDAPLIKADGRESLLRAVELFVNREGVSRVLLVVPGSRAEEYKRKVGGHLSFMGVRIVTGGESFFDQLKTAREQLDPGTTHVLVHDAARPAVPYTDLDALAAAAERHPVAALAIPVAGPLLNVGRVSGAATLGGDRVAQLVTPIAFDIAALDAAIADGALPGSLQWIEGSPLNLRCGQASAGLMKAMIGLLPKPKVKAPSSPFEEAQW
ncbi:MAG TPA: 2-C-methyl-D-erythritol 4-phosphate cytidylyltransferase [Tepidisphaeraceae bacterium]|jgi:2-C-methyl-D-erythritol 4-phosphate cytidylyltransferase